MGDSKQRKFSNNRSLRQRRPASADPTISNEVSAKPSEDESNAIETLQHPQPAWVGCLSDDYAKSVYSRHAAKFPEKFRASVDYSIREKPLQVLIGMIVLGILFTLACGSSWLWEADAGGRFFEQRFEDLSEKRQQDLRFHALRVLGCLTVAISGYCFLESRDGLLVRPHPGFWRLIHGLCFTYYLFFVLLLAVHREDGRFLVQMFVPGVGRRKNIFAGTLVLDCSMNTNTLMRQLTSVWFYSHAVGWFLKMCIFRSWMFNLTFSILFEFCEMSLQWLIPEFRECWWDSVFIDAIVSNLMGMIFGCAVMRWFGKKHFDWLGAYPTYQKILLKFTPFSSYDYEWSFFRTPRHLLMTSLLLFFSLVAELNVFFLMTVLNIPASHFINPLRLVLLGLLAFPAVAEFYAQLHFKYDRMGGNVFLFVMILAVEILVIMKYGVDRFFSFSPGADVLLPWLLTGVFFGMWCRSYFAKASQEQEKEEQSIKDSCSAQRSLQDTVSLIILKIPPQACFLPLLYLANNYHYG